MPDDAEYVMLRADPKLVHEMNIQKASSNLGIPADTLRGLLDGTLLALTPAEVEHRAADAERAMMEACYREKERVKEHWKKTLAASTETAKREGYEKGLQEAAARLHAMANEIDGQGPPYTTGMVNRRTCLRQAADACVLMDLRLPGN